MRKQDRKWLSSPDHLFAGTGLLRDVPRSVGSGLNAAAVGGWFVLDRTTNLHTAELNGQISHVTVPLLQALRPTREVLS